MPANEDQIKFWNEKGRDWTELQDRMDANLSGAHAAVMAYAAAQSGENVLDIGCGTGQTSLALADAVGPRGRVTGVDVSQPMLGLARRRAEGRTNASFTLADASVQPFKPEFDLLFSRFGVMFFDDPIAAFANLHSGLKPGGRLAFVCWRTAPENLWAAAPLMAARALLPEQPPPDPLAPGPFAFANAQRIRDVLAGGFWRHLISRNRMASWLWAAMSYNLWIGPCRAHWARSMRPPAPRSWMWCSRRWKNSARLRARSPRRQPAGWSARVPRTALPRRANP